MLERSKIDSKGAEAMDERERDTVIFETGGGTSAEFTVVHEFCHDGSMYAVLQKAGSPGDTLIAEVSDPLGPDEEFVPLPLSRQQALLELLRRSGSEGD
jgi:hypothetical protein